MKKIFLLSAMFIILSLAFCGCGASTSGGSAEATTEEQTPHNNLTIETDTAKLVYKDYQYVGRGFYGASSTEDYTKTIIVEFDYTNLQDEISNFQNDFYLTAFQNGTQIDEASSYLLDAAPESLDNFFNQVMKDGTLTVGRAFVLKDYSPITFNISYSNPEGETTDYQMILDIEEFVDNSFDVTKLYGEWKDKKSGDKLSISQYEIRYTYNDGDNSSYQDQPEFYTEGDIFYSDLDKVGDLQIDSSGKKLKMKNDNFTFVKTKDAATVTGKFKKLKVGEEYKNKFVKMVFDSPDHDDKLSVTNGSFTQSISCSTEGSQMFWFPVELKNRSDSSYEITGNNSIVQFIFDGEKEYSGTLANVYGGNAKDMEPDATNTVYAYAEVPESVIDSYKKVVVKIGFDDDFNDFGSSREITSFPHLIKLVYKK